MLNFILVVYVASTTASFQTMGPFDTKQACDNMQIQMTENFKDIKSACLAMSTTSLQSIAGKYDPAKAVKAAAVETVPLPKPKPRIKIIKNTLCKDNTQ